MVFATDAASSLPLQQVLHSTVHNPAMFNNNNNYLPNLNQFGPAHLPVSTVAATAHPSDISTAPGTLQAGMPSYQMLGNQPLRHFRFLSPTQGAAVPTWVPPTSTMGMASAPGMGVSWQHSVPTTMPWANHTAPNFNAEVAPTSSSVQSPTQQSFPPSVSDRFSQSQFAPAPVQRRKRHSHDEDTPQGPSSKKYLSERMAACFKQLQIAPVQQSSSGGPWGSGVFGKQDNGWQRFCEVERRLQADVAEAEIEEAECMLESPGEPRLVFAEGVGEEILTPNPVLPEAIISTLTKPCMELVLYKEPDILPAITVPHVTNNSSSIISMESTTDSSSAPIPPSRINGRHEGAVGMNGISAAALPGLHSNEINPSSALLSRNTSDTNMFDNIDDDMDL